MRVFHSLDQLRAAVGHTVGPGDWLTVDQLCIDQFAEATGDDQWIHIDEDRAKAGPYGTTIAHGYLTLSLIPVLAGRLYTLAFGSARMNYGVNKVRFPATVPSGSRIRATATFVDVRDTPPGAQVTVGWVLVAEDMAKPVCVAETITLVAS